MRLSMLISLAAIGCGEKAGVSVTLTEADADCTWYKDADGDGYADPFDSIEDACDAAPEGAMAAAEGAGTVIVSAAIEAEVAQLGDAEEKREYFETLGLSEAGLDRVIHAGYSLLDLITFFTSGPKESRAWTIAAGTTAAPAAAKIHTDFERGFIAAETISYDDFIECNGEQGAKDTGKMRLEGRDYTVQDADVILFRFNV